MSEQIALNSSLINIYDAIVSGIDISGNFIQYIEDISANQLVEISKLNDLSTNQLTQINQLEDISLNQLNGNTLLSGIDTDILTINDTLINDISLNQINGNLSLTNIDNGLNTNGVYIKPYQYTTNNTIRVINSLDRSNGDQFDPTFGPITALSGVYKPIHFSMLNNLYNVNGFNNKIYFQENGGPLLTATLTKSYYIESQLVTEIKTQMDATGANTYTVTHDSKTNKFTIASSPDTFAFLFGGNTTNSARLLLGMTENDVIPEVSIQVSELCIDISPYKQIYLTITESSNDNILITNGNQYNMFIWTNTSFGDTIQYDFSNQDVYMNISSTTEIQVTIKDINNNLLELTNEWQLMLQKV